MLHLISSMATRPVLADWAAALQQHEGITLQVQSMGGIDAAQRVAAGEPLDLVMLAQDALDKLAATGHVLPRSVMPLLRSDTAVAVAVGTPVPDVSSQAALVAALKAAQRIGYSTGPSGTALLGRLRQWGLSELLQQRLVQARPGVPVGQLVARGEVDIGFQQLSELQGLPGVVLCGRMPPGAEISTVFAVAVAQTSQQAAEAERAIAWMRSASAAVLAERHGMEAMAT